MGVGFDRYLKNFKDLHGIVPKIGDKFTQRYNHNVLTVVGIEVKNKTLNESKWVYEIVYAVTYSEIYFPTMTMSSFSNCVLLNNSGCYCV